MNPALTVVSQPSMKWARQADLLLARISDYSHPGSVKVIATDHQNS